MGDLAIGLIGDFDPQVAAHRAIPLAVRAAADALGVDVTAEWLATDSIGAGASVGRFNGLWCVPGSPYRSMDGASQTTETYHCRYGLNPQFRAALVAGPLRAAADDSTGEVRAVELDGHPFFVAALFQPERAALTGRPAPLVSAFLSACASMPATDG